MNWFNIWKFDIIQHLMADEYHLFAPVMTVELEDAILSKYKIQMIGLPYWMDDFDPVSVLVNWIKSANLLPIEIETAWQLTINYN